jgi:glutamine cyclotransferase
MRKLSQSIRRSRKITGAGLAALLASLSLVSVAGCREKSESAPGSAKIEVASQPIATAAQKVPTYTYEVVNVWPHDRSAFTEGLIYLKGIFIESTGIERHSTLRKVEPQTGRVLQQLTVSASYFAEGMTVLNGKIFQLTWQNHVGFVYDLNRFEKENEFSYTGEGWGLTTDGKSLIMSDGTSLIRFLDPVTFKVTRTIEVTKEGQPLPRLNELEYIKGEIFANIWQTDGVARIDPGSGKVLGMIDFSGLLVPQDLAGTDVLNGIAYDALGDRLFVTGKYWPKLFEVRLKPR